MTKEAPTLARGNGRVDQRVARLVTAAEKLEARLKASPDHPKADSWRDKLNEYADSLESFQTFGRELPAPVLKAVEIAVPVGRFRTAAAKGE